jgi:hypothetical protein
MKLFASVFSMSSCFKERIFTDVVLSVPLNERVISSTSAELLNRSWLSLRERLVLSYIPLYALTWNSVLQMYVRHKHGVTRASVWFRPEIEGNLELLITVSALRQTRIMLNRPPRVTLTGIEASHSPLAEFVCKQSHFHRSRIYATSGTQHDAASLTVFRQYLV